MLKHNRPTCFDLTALKGKRPLVQVMVRSAEEAAAAAAAGVDMITSLTYGVHINADDCIRAGFKAMRGGADAVYTATSTANIAHMFAEGIGHRLCRVDPDARDLDRWLSRGWQDR
jgi:3-methyl-2-oxobutanoate hydroxymethyltransferase